MKAFVLVVSLMFALGCQERSNPAESAPPSPPPSSVPVTAEMSGDVQTATLTISGAEYQPPTINVRAGVPLRLNVTRDEKAGCGDVLSIPSQNIKRDIPVGQVTTIEFTPQNAGDIEFTCGMDMMRGRLVVQEPGV